MLCSLIYYRLLDFTYCTLHNRIITTSEGVEKTHDEYAISMIDKLDDER